METQKKLLKMFQIYIPFYEYFMDPYRDTKSILYKAWVFIFKNKLALKAIIEFAIKQDQELSFKKRQVEQLLKMNLDVIGFRDSIDGIHHRIRELEDKIDEVGK